MTIDLESLITVVTERVMERMKLNKRAAKRPAIPVEVDIFFDHLTQGVPIIIPYRIPLTVEIASVRIIKALCKLATGHGLKSAAVTAKLKARDCYPINDPESRDTRRRFFIDGKQEVCYAFTCSSTMSAACVSEAIQELSAKYPELRNG